MVGKGYSYCHCQHVMPFFWSSTNSLGEVVIQNGNLLAPGAPLYLFALHVPLISPGGPAYTQTVGRQANSAQSCVDS